MSSLIVEICKIDDIKPHSNADKLELATVKGWQVVIGKGTHQIGDTITYIPIDTVLPLDLSDTLGVTKYLSNGRVRCAKLRGEPSFGIVAPPYGVLGENVAEKMGITKYVHPVKYTVGDAEATHPLFDGYTDMENMRNFPDIFVDGEEVIATEKIHGTCSAVAMITEEDGRVVRMARSKGMQRKESPDSLYWMPFKIEGVKNLLESLSHETMGVILYGEIYGRVQSLKYGHPNDVCFRAFDIKVEGRYVPYDAFKHLCDTHGIETCPVIYRGPYSLAKIREVASGRSTIPGADNIREGVVCRPLVERNHPKTGRVLLKYVSDEYLLGGSDESVGGNAE